ncbi:hypothetical protein DUQ06_07830 [Salmonella enterica subsp. diarizonae]|uniref:Uncharacterized protein n=1 Tax=Salmonella enterica TaxID=28901 RepID=A0A403SWD8_SALER|nr:hypothetical protein [Salmonella enterica]ECC9619363.1 hypothetical protein [Salmonella enterica subsp. diarizonae]ECU8747318.1 hypothetical protein [Salmonella enterica subsp. diarizonae str. CFSAN000558]EHQ9195711.1 hypothetical protein [Salmonella enterica subsp. diarizonae serovar 50:k:z:[z50],[z57],[z68], [z86]]HAE8381017.1 hypothetical protein [Salmonella enterica subsp. diarizonae serovar 50:k:z]ASG77173.1 hypothetical protein LFZ53_19610 [Salmonella enterica subsp. diarizonae serova
MLEDIIRSYLYTQYNDDDNIRAFVTAYNTMAKNIYDWMRSANLPIFVGGYNAGDQLRWIARGIYGVKPPVLESGRQLVIGAFNTCTFNTVPFNTRRVINQSEQVVVSDDLFKRIMTWNFYKGDGFYFTIPWLKRRIMRFITGVNGVDVVNDQHWSISVLFSGGGASVSIIKGFRKLTDSSVYNAQTFNSRAYNQKTSVLIKSNEYEYASLFKQAFDSGLLHMPFYQPVSVTIVG